MIALALSLALLAPQDLVIRGGEVWTGAAPWRGDLVVRDGRFTQDRPSAAAAILQLPAGAFVMPGLGDAHGHLAGLGRSLVEVDLVGVRTYAELVARTGAQAQTQEDGSWVRGRGWDQNDWPGGAFPTHQELSTAVPDHPVFLVRIDGHAALVNARALRLAGIDRATQDPPGGEILRDADGEPTGVLIDRAMALVTRHLPETGAGEREQFYLRAQQACLEAGLTCVHDAGVPGDDVDLLRRLHAAGRWQLRVYVMLAAQETDRIRQGPWQTPDLVLTVRAVKGMADGALGSRGAVLLQEYSDRPGHRGLFVTPTAALQPLAQLCADHGFQFCVHAIGDRANRDVLEVFAATRFAEEAPAPRWRVEHAQIVAPPDFARFRDLGVVASMQPTHLTSDMPWAPARLGPERVRGAYAFRTMLAHEVPLAFGSDFPVESHDPRRGLYAAQTTRPWEGDGAELRADQKLSLDETLRAFTHGVAHAAFQERELGRIEPGKLADLTIFDRRPTPEHLHEARVLATVIAGRVVHRDLQ